ncbi:MAG: Uma2 family endonuclease [Gemmatimonadales bacterium]
MSQATERWTAEMVRALPDDGNRYEVIGGALCVTPAPSPDHQRAVAALLVPLAQFVKAHRLGDALTSPADIEFDEEDLVQPDVLVAPLVDGRRPKQWSDIKTLLLAVEVLSPSTARADRTIKRRLFQRVAVPEYWIVDVEARLVERWRPGDGRPEILTDALTWRPAGAPDALGIDLPTLFAEITATD